MITTSQPINSYSYTTEHIGVQAKSEVADHQQEDRPRIMYLEKSIAN